MSLNCRFYRNQYPRENDCVVVRFKRDIPSVGVYCSLLEYNGLEGMIKMSEISRSKLAKKPQILKTEEVVRVIQVNAEKGFIDLSRIRQINPKTIAETEVKWNEGKRVLAIMRYVARKTGYSTEQLYEMFAWPAADIYGSSYEGIKALLRDPQSVFSEFDIPLQFQGPLLEYSEERMKPVQLRLKTKLEITLNSWEGIEGIKDACMRGMEESNENCPITIICLRAPLYRIGCSTLDETVGRSTLGKAVKKISDRISELGGKCRVQAKDPKKKEVEFLPIFFDVVPDLDITVIRIEEELIMTPSKPCRPNPSW